MTSRVPGASGWRPSPRRTGCGIRGPVSARYPRASRPTSVRSTASRRLGASGPAPRARLRRGAAGRNLGCHRISRRLATRPVLGPPRTGTARTGGAWQPSRGVAARARWDGRRLQLYASSTGLPSIPRQRNPRRSPRLRVGRDVGTRSVSRTYRCCTAGTAPRPPRSAVSVPHPCWSISEQALSPGARLHPRGPRGGQLGHLRRPRRGHAPGSAPREAAPAHAYAGVEAPAGRLTRRVRMFRAIPTTYRRDCTNKS